MTSTHITSRSQPLPDRMLAPLEPQVLSVLMDTTNQCNLQCRMCYFSFPEVAHRPSTEMSVETFERLAGEVLPYARMLVLSAGCEPLVHTRFPELLEVVAQHRVPHVRFLTNAQLLTESAARACIEHGVHEIHVSIDGATRETYEWVRRGGSFDRLVENLQRLDALKDELGSSLPVVQFNVTLMKANVDELPRFVELARQVGATQLACRHLMPYDGLDVEDQCLHHDRKGANRAMQRGLDAALAAGLHVVMFPDLFDTEAQFRPPWIDMPDADPTARHVGFEARTAESFGRHGAIHVPGGVSAHVSVPSDSAAASSGTAAGAGSVASVGSPAHAEPPARAASPARAAPLAALLRKSWRYARGGFRSPAWSPTVPDPGALPRTPFGAFDGPTSPRVHAQGVLAFHGWALHVAGVEKIELCQLPSVAKRRWRRGVWQPEVLAVGKRLLGARPDVTARYAALPDSLRAGFVLRLDTNALDISEHGLDVYLLVTGRDGRRSIVDSRHLTRGEAALDPGSVYCAKPFTSVYFDAKGNVYPYPDCQTVEPFGQMPGATSFEELWYGPEFSALRRRIYEVDPPSMCQGCPDFVNRNPDDPDYFVPKQLEANFRLPEGEVEGPELGASASLTDCTLHGWAAGFSDVTRVEILREASPDEAREHADGEPTDSERVASESLVSLGDARHGLARSDLVQRYGRWPNAARAGWSFSLTDAQVPPTARELVLVARAHSAEGSAVDVGSVRLHVHRDTEGAITLRREA